MLSIRSMFWLKTKVLYIVANSSPWGLLNREKRTQRKSLAAFRFFFKILHPRLVDSFIDIHPIQYTDSLGLM